MGSGELRDFLRSEFKRKFMILNVNKGCGDRNKVFSRRGVDFLDLGETLIGIDHFLRSRFTF